MGIQEMQKKHLQQNKKKMMKENKDGTMYGTLPVIPSKKDVINKMDKKHQNKLIKAQQNKNKLNNDKKNIFSIQPSIKPFIKRSLEPERRKTNIGTHRNSKRRIREKLDDRKTISFIKKMEFWSNTTFNQRL